MIKSMTGYGRFILDDGKRNSTVEIKALNSKYLDVQIRLPKIFNEKEMELRNVISEYLVRGKISVTVEHVKLEADNLSVTINEPLFKSYFTSLKNLSTMVGATDQDLFKLALQYPDVQIQNQDDDKIEEEWQFLKEVAVEACKKCDAFRIKEGEGLYAKLLSYIDEIEVALQKIEELDPERLKNLREKIKKSLEDLKLEDYDQNRFEQELVYYIEKLDISEEKVRLLSHTHYFKEVLDYPESNGKKLNFIAQEIGREINTIGSKASYAPIQKLVVGMKDELEKIKEQIQNIV